MTTPDTNRAVPATDAAAFVSTHWSLVVRASGSSPEQAAAALEILCKAYWYPLYAFVRRQGHAPHDAQDLTQEFFARLLARRDLEHVNPAKGRFRSFLLASMNHFLANEWDKARALKRGGGRQAISLDEADAEGRYAQEDSPSLSPEMLFEQRWAMTVLDAAMARLRVEFSAAGKARQFEVLKDFLSGVAADGDYAAVAGSLGLNPGAVAVAVHRLRQRYKELVRVEIAETVASPLDVEDEMRHLFAALG